MSVRTSRDSTLSQSCGGTGYVAKFPTSPDRDGAGVSAEHIFFLGGDPARSIAQKQCEAEQWLQQTKEYVEKNIQMVVEFFADEISGCGGGDGKTIRSVKINAIRPDATYLVWVDCAALEPFLLCRRRSSAHQLFWEEARVLTSAGSEFGGGPEESAANFVRINAACSARTLRAALVRMRRAVEISLSR